MDWAALISDLENAGVSQRLIAQEVGCSQPYISQMKANRRRSPTFAIGSAIQALHQKRCTKPARRKTAS